MMELTGGVIDARTGEIATMCPQVRDELRNVMNGLVEVCEAMAQHVRECPDEAHQIETGREWARTMFTGSLIACSVTLPDGTRMDQDSMKLPPMVVDMLRSVPAAFQPDGWHELIEAATETPDDVTADDVDAFLKTLFEDEQPETD